MLFFCMELCGDEEGDERTEFWTNAIDRGGLWHINDNTYMIFCIIEDEIRQHLKVSALKVMDTTTKQAILGELRKNEDLAFQWTLITADADDSVGKEVLDRIMELYLTIRGFAFASSCLEMYKQRHKKEIQKSKALRKKLAAEKGDSD